MGASTPTAALSVEDVLYSLIDHGVPCSTIIRLSTFCRSLRHTSRAVQQHMFRPTRFLRGLFANINDYGDLLASDELIITGLPVLRYITDFVSRPAELVIIATPRVLHRVISLLLSNEYVLDSVHHNSSMAADLEPIRDAYCYRLRGAGPLVWVEVPKRSITHVFLSQRSTLLLNGVYRQRFFSLCPRASILHRQGVVLHRRLFIAQNPGEPVAQPGGNPLGLTQIRYYLRTSRLRGLHVTLSPNTRTIGDRWTWFAPTAGPCADFGDVLTQEWSLSARVRTNDAIGFYVTLPPFTRGPNWSAAYALTPSRFLVPIESDAAPCLPLRLPQRSPNAQPPTSSHAASEIGHAYSEHTLSSPHDSALPRQGTRDSVDIAI